MDPEWLEKIKEHWHKPLGLALAIVAAVIVAGLVTQLSDKIYWMAPIVVLVPGAWFWSRRIPRARHNKIGFAIAIDVEEVAQAKTFATDLIYELTRLIRAGSSGKAFDVIEIPPHTCATVDIDDDDAIQKLRLSARAAYLMFAKVRIRKHDNRDHTVLDLKAVVGHSPLQPSVQSQFKQEFSELLPSRIQMHADAELFNCVVTGEMTALVAKYVIGIAAALSGDLDYGEALQSDVIDTINFTSIRGSALHDTLRQRAPQRLAEIRGARMNAALKNWLVSRDPRHIELMNSVLSSIPVDLSTSPGMLTMRAIIAFLKDRDVDRAISLLSATSIKRDATWCYNMGFLFAYKGNMKKASQYYRQAVIMARPADLAEQLETFMINVLDQEPDKVQLHYCIARVIREVQGDNERAMFQLQSFLDNCPVDKYLVQRKHAQDWINEGSTEHRK